MKTRLDRYLTYTLHYLWLFQGVHMLGEELERAITATWMRLRHRILADPHELQRRLARRRAAHLNRPPRAWCIALRASDRRITPARWIIIPEHAMDRDHPEHPYEPIEHEVRIDARVLRRFCRPVYIARPAQEVTEVAEMLGVHPSSLRKARHAGVFREYFYKNLGGKRGHPVPVIYKDEPLDPSASNFHAPPHPLWGSTWEHLPEMVPQDFQQAVIRRPFFKRMGNRRSDDLQALGYRWLCPSCKKEVRTIYYPLPVRTHFDSWFTDPAIKLKLTDADLPTPPAPTFACRDCHPVQYSSSMQPNFWNQLISCLTGGMLYGREVQKPPSFQPHRQRTRIRQINRAAPRRRQVLTRILNGWSVQQICRDLQMNYHVVHNHISHLCREEDVPDRHALVAKLGGSKSPPFNQIERAGIRRFRVQELLLQGCTYKQIMQKLDMDFPTINRDTQTIYKLHGVSGGGQKARRALAAKLGLHFTTPNDLLRQQILNLLYPAKPPPTPPVT